MADTLKVALLRSDRRDELVTDLQALVEQEVADRSGLTGGVIKTGYAAAKKIRPGIVRRAIDGLLEEFLDALEPHWADYQAEPAADFGAFLSRRPQQVSHALLTVTDRRAERSSAPINAVYAKLRPRGQDNVIQALPRLGHLVERHASSR